MTDVAVAAFAVWTLVYDAGLLLRLATTALLVLWAVGLAAVAFGVAWARRGADRVTDAGQRARVAPPRPAGAARLRRHLGPAGAVFGLAAAAAAGLHSKGLPWAWTWLLGTVSVLVTGAAVVTRNTAPGAAAGNRQAETRSEAGSVLALCAGIAGAIFSLYVVRPDGDDAYFVSRAVWTAQHGRIPVRDILFTNQVAGQIPAEPPVASIEVLNGTLARLLGMPAAAFTYAIALPVATFIAIWAVWRLLRHWAPRRAVLCFAVAMVYLLWSGTSDASFGSFHLVRMWQGKAVLVSAMVPLLYTYLTQWAEHRSKRGLLLAVTASIGAVGLSSAAITVVPLITAAAAAPLMAARRTREGLAAVAVLVYPCLAGLGLALFHPVRWPSLVEMPAPTVWSWVLLGGVFGAISGAALWTSPWLVRRGVPALIAAGIAAVVTVLMLPGVLALISRATGAGVTIWRVLWVVPGPVLPGLLAATPVPARFARARGIALRRAVLSGALLPAAVASAAMLAVGVPIWSYRNGHATVTDHPSWKYDPLSLRLARDAIAADHQPGYLLSTRRVMSAVPLITTNVRAVNGRSYYLHLLPVRRQFVEDRDLLTRMAGAVLPMPEESAVRAALARVGVGYACVWRVNTGALHLLTAAGFTQDMHVGSFQCLRRA